MTTLLFDATPFLVRGYDPSFLAVSVVSAVLVSAAFVGAARVIGRKRAKRELRRQASFIGMDPNPIVEVCRDGRIAYLNRAAERLFPDLAEQGLRHPFLAELPLYVDTLIKEEGRSLVREIQVGNAWHRQEFLYLADTDCVRIYAYDVTCRRRMEEIVKRSEEKYRTLYETMLQGVLYQDAAGTIISANKAARAILGITAGEIPGARPGAGHGESVREDGSPLEPEDHPSMAALRTGREVRDMIMGIRDRSSGGYRWLSVNAVPQFRPGERKPCQVYTIFDDITERLQAEKEVRDSETRYRKLFESARDGILILEAGTGIVVDVNPMVVSLFGFAHDDLIGKKLGDIPPFADIEAGAAVVGEIIGKEYARYENLPLRTKNGRIIETELVSNICRMDAGAVIQCSIRDITERHQAERRILYLSFHDRVTGLYNRTYFEEELRRLDTKRCLPISLIMGDINNLKLVNDAFGHREGDQLLAKIAGILKDSCRDEDIIARWGGDEFVILLPKTDEKTAVDIVKRIRRECAEEKGAPVKPAIALGIATKEKPGADIHEVLKEAEDRMYRNKLTDGRSGRNAIISSMLRTLRARSHETSQHTQRLRKCAVEIGAAVGLSVTQLDELALLSVLHDIGKVAIPDEILMKPGPLTAKEWKTMTRHPEVGYRIAQSIAALAHIADAVLAHHERWDGTGYPQGLRKKEIPLLARILAIVDAFDVMIHGRSYERPMSRKQALDELKRNSGSQFDPDLVHVFIDRVTHSPSVPREDCVSAARNAP